VIICLPLAVSPQVDETMKSVTHGQCDARPSQSQGITAPLTGTKIIIVLDDKGTCVSQRFESRVHRPLQYNSKSHITTVYSCKRYR